MRILFVLIFSLMVFAPQSFAQKDDYSAINAKNCGVDAFYEGRQETYGQKKMQEGYLKAREKYLREHYRLLSKEERSGWSEDAFVESCTKTDKWWKEFKEKKG